MFTPENHTFAICAYKESEYLEECVLSVLEQTVKTNVIIATSTPNELIKSIGEKYSIPVYVNNGKSGIGPDWNYAISCVKTPLVTIAHQDDLYFPKYAEVMLKSINNSDNPIIFFSHYAEVREGKIVTDNKILNIKKKLLSPLKPKFAQKNKLIRRRVLSLGNSICCPAVTYVSGKLPDGMFTCNYKSNIDWEMWEMLSKQKGSFAYTPEQLMGHRVHEASTTSELIENNTRTEEDYNMLCKFWPKPVASLIMAKYKKSQNSNQL